MYYGLSAKDARRIAFQLAMRNVDKDLFHCHGRTITKLEKIGYAVVLSLRMPGVSSFGRAIYFNRAMISKFFDNLDAVMKRYKFNPERIFYLDGTCLTTVHKADRGIVPTGIK